MNNHSHEQLNMHSEYVQQPPFKRQRNSDPSNAVVAVNSSLPPLNQPINKGANHIFYKTRMCAKFRLGVTCRNGENCNFAHGIEDMRHPPPNWQELVGLGDEEERPSANWDEDQKIIQKMKICKKYYNGEECPYGERCSFLHEDPAKFREGSGRFRENSVSVRTNTSQMTYPNGSNYSHRMDLNFEKEKSDNTTCRMSRVIVNPTTSWKNNSCDKWETRLYPNGEKYHFARGHAEANSAVAVSKLAIDTAMANARSLSVPDKEKQNMKCLLKWKGPKKINRIYADWLDDFSLVPNLHSKVES